MSSQPLFRLRGLPVETHLQEARSKRIDQGIKEQSHSSMTVEKSLMHEGENMSTLHAKLHREADKIRRWKIQIELELRDKEKKLTEASMRIEAMKKSLLDLQLENERSHAKLQEEISNREEVMRRVQTTRELCNILKCHASKLDDKLTKCETEKSELKIVESEYVHHFEELNEKFNNLKITADEKEKKIKNLVKFDRESALQREKELTLKLKSREEETQNLKDELDIISQELICTKAALETKESTLESTIKTLDESLEKVSCLSKELVIKEDDLKESSLKICALLEDKVFLNKRIDECDINIKSLQKSKDKLALEMSESNSKLEEQLKETYGKVDGTQKKIDDMNIQLQALESKLKEATALVESLKTEKDLLMLEKGEIEMHLDVQKFQVNNLMEEKAEDKQELHNLNEEIKSLKQIFEKENHCKIQAEETVAALQKQVSALTVEKDDLTEYIAKLKADVDSKQKNILSNEEIISERDNKIKTLECHIEKLEKLNASERQNMHILEENLQELSQVLLVKNQELDSKDRDLEMLRNNNEDLISKLESKDDEHQTMLKNVEDMRRNSSHQSDQIKELTLQLKEQNEQSKENDKSLTSQQKKLAVTLKHNKELEKEINILRNKLEFGDKALLEQEKKLNNLHKELNIMQNMKDEAERSRHHCEKEMIMLKQQSLQEQEDARLAMKKATEMQENAQKEKENAIALTDCQLSEMMATLDSYKQNNEILISEKDKEIQSLRAKAEMVEIHSQEKEKELIEWKKEVEKLKLQISSLMLRQEVNQAIDEDSNSGAKKKLERTPLVKSNFEMSDDLENKHQQSSPMIVAVTPKKPNPHTPLALLTPKTSNLKTPQRSILRVCNSVNKRRKVAFNSEDMPCSSDDSDLMELDAIADLKFSSDQHVSLNSFNSPAIGRRGGACELPHRATPSRIPLNRSIRETSKRQTYPATPELTEKVSETHLNLDRTEKVNGNRAKVEKPDDSKMNLRKTPVKKTSKFFTTSPKNRAVNAKANKAKSKDSETDWFDIDSVYGFVCED